MESARSDSTTMREDVTVNGLEPKQAHVESAKRALPGPGYRAVLVWIHRALKPSSYLEIGVNKGESLRAARPETICVGIDPMPMLDTPPDARTRLFRMTSDEFFASQHLPQLLGRDHFSLAFIDGLHLFEQALLDFIHLERFAGKDSVIILHDCLPLDSATSDRTRTTEFYSGDVWKLALCLRETRPDLQMVIVPTAPTGLCIVSGLDPASTVLEREYERCLAAYLSLTFDDYRTRASHMPPAIANTKAAVMSYVGGLQSGAPARSL